MKDLLIALEATLVPLSAERSYTNTLTHQAGNEVAKSELIEDIAETIRTNAGISDEILREVWAMITEEGL